MPLEKYSKADLVKKRACNFIEVRDIGDENNNPGGIPSCVMEKEHPGENRNGCVIHKVLCQHVLPGCEGLFIWFFLSVVYTGRLWFLRHGFNSCIDLWSRTKPLKMTEPVPGKASLKKTLIDLAGI
jgi:hypothetical protein